MKEKDSKKRASRERDRNVKRKGDREQDFR